MKRQGLLAAVGVAAALVLALGGLWLTSAQADWPPVKVDLAIQQEGSLFTATVWVSNEGDFDTDTLNVRGQVPKGAKYVDSWAGSGRGFNKGVFDGNDVGWANAGVKAGGKQGPFVYIFDTSALSPSSPASASAWVSWAGKVPGTAVSEAVGIRTLPTEAEAAPTAPEAMPMAPAGPAAAPAPAAALSPEMLAEGRAVFAKSCAACHGAGGEGTAIAPKVAGHSIASTKTQVRSPLGRMPAFPPAQLSDADLDKAASFILSLGPAATPVLEWEKAASETMHHWMALLAIKGNDIPDARMHLQEALAFVEAPMHRAEMEKALDLLSKGELHDAKHEIEEMAGSESPSGVSMQRFHLILAQRAVEEMNAAEARRHLERFAVKATDQQKALVREALEKIDANDFHEAEHEVEELLES